MPLKNVLAQQNQLVYFEDKIIQYVVLDVLQGKQNESHFKTEIFFNSK